MCRSSAQSIPVSVSRTLGINTICVGACGAISRNAKARSSSYTTSLGISLRIILSKRVSSPSLGFITA